MTCPDCGKECSDGDSTMDVYIRCLECCERIRKSYYHGPFGTSPVKNAYFKMEVAEDNMTDLQDIMTQIMGIHKDKQIMDLWIEVSYLRHILNHIVAKKIDIQDIVNQECLILCRQMAIKDLEDKFPHLKIQDNRFNDNKQEDQQDTDSHLE